MGRREGRGTLSLMTYLVNEFEEGRDGEHVVLDDVKVLNEVERLSLPHSTVISVQRVCHTIQRSLYDGVWPTVRWSQYNRRTAV